MTNIQYHCRFQENARVSTGQRRPGFDELVGLGAALPVLREAAEHSYVSDLDVFAYIFTIYSGKEKGINERSKLNLGSLRHAVPLNRQK